VPGLANPLNIRKKMTGKKLAEKKELSIRDNNSKLDAESCRMHRLK